MLGRNPFSDPEEWVPEDAGTPTTPVIKLVEIGEGVATLEITLLDATGKPVVTINRYELRLGSSFAIVDMSVDITVKLKEQFNAR